MGVYIHYSFHAECPEEELLARLGLLYRARDTSGFYNHRSWKKAVVAAAQAAGMPIQDVSNPATKHYNLVHVDDDVPGKAT